MRKKHGKTSVRVENRTCITIRIHKHNNKNIKPTEINKSIQNVQPCTTIYTKEHHYSATLRYTSPHFTQLHYTTLIDTSLPLV
jgi:hypothetical protein